MYILLSTNTVNRSRSERFQKLQWQLPLHLEADQSCRLAMALSPQPLAKAHDDHNEDDHTFKRSVAALPLQSYVIAWSQMPLLKIPWRS